MSETVDTRVVEAKFDSKQFEKGVDKTVKKLDELKKSLNDATTGKSVAEIGNKMQEASDKASSSLEKLQDRFTSFTGMLKQKLLSGIADEIVGVFFKIKSSFEGMIKSLSSAQIGVGMQRYTDILTSVRTLVSAGTSQDKAYEAIERLGTYADQTSYSLDSMVATMSKFKTAGADIDTAARMIEGLSNAAASMGVNAQQAERAYLNLQQAYSKKVMLQNDWMSFESLPMVGTQFNQAIIDAAVKVGTLKQSTKTDKKVVEELKKKLKDGEITQEEYNKQLENAAKTYQTVKKKGTQVKSASGITAENIGSKLSSRWFTDEVMEEVFGNTYYFEQIGIDEVNDLKRVEKQLKEDVKEGKKTQEEADKAFQDYLDEISAEKRELKKKELDDLVAANKMTQEAANKALAEFDKHNHLTKFAYDAFRAGQEARSFTDVINTLKDAVSRGWAKSFELIFGKLDEAADFFTHLTESNLADAVYRIGEFRNLVLENWQRVGGRNDMINTLQTIDNLFGSIFQKIGLIEKDSVFDEKEYERLLESDKSTGGNQAELYKMWAEETDAANANEFSKAAEDLGRRIAHVTANIGLYIEKIQAFFTSVDPRTNKSRLDRIVDLFNDVSSIVHGAASDAAMVIHNIFLIVGKFEPVLNAVFGAIQKVLDPIKQLFNPDDKNGKGGALYTALENSLLNIGKVVDILVGKAGNGPLVVLVDVLGTVASFFIDTAVSTFLTNVQFFSDAFGLLLEVLGFGSAQTDKGKSVAQGIADDITSLGDACKDAFSAISGFFSSVIADIRTWLGLSDQTTKGGNIFTNISNWWNTNESVQTIKKAIDDFVIRVGDWIKNIPENISKFAIDIGDFFKSIFYKKTTRSISPNTTIVEWAKTDITIWIEKAVEDIKTWFADLPNNITNLGIEIGDFFKSIFYKKETKYNGSMLETKWVKKEITKEIENFFVEIGDWFKDIPNKIRGLFYQEVETEGKRGGKVKTTIETPLKQWLDKAILDIKNFIKDIPNKLKKIPSLVSEFFKNIFYKTEKKNLIIGPNGNKQTIDVLVKTPLKEFLDTLVKAISDFVKDLPTHIHNAFVGIGDFFKMIWDEILGNNPDASTNEASQTIEENVQKGLDGSLSNVTTKSFWTRIKEIGSDVWNGILTIFTGNSDKEFNNNWIAEKVKTGIENISGWAEGAWNKTKDFIINLPNTIAGIFTKENGGSEEEGGIKGAIERFGTNVGTWISEIPSTLLKTWENVEKTVGTLWDKIIGWITGENADNDKLLKPKYQEMYNEAARVAPRDALEATKKYLLDLQWREDNPILANFEDFFNRLKEYVVNKIKNLPTDIATGLSQGASLVNSVLEEVTGWFNTENKNDEEKKKAEEAWNKKWIPFNKDTYESEMRRAYNEAYKIQKNVDLRNGIITDTSELEKRASDAAEAAAQAAGNAYKATTRESEAALKEYSTLGLDTKSSPFIEAIADFGSNLWVIITETIPGFIGSGFEWVKAHAEQWYDAIKGLFSGGEGKVEEEADSFGAKVEKALKNVFKPHTFKQSEYDTLINAHMFNTAEYYKKETSNPIINFFKEVVSTVGTIFKDLGPTILDGINSALTWIGGKFGDASKFLSDLVSKGESIEDVLAEKMTDPETGEEDPIWTAIKAIGQNIWDIITKTIPDFISSAADYIGQQLPKLFSGIFSGNNKAVENSMTEQLAALLQEEQKYLDEGEYEKAAKTRDRYNKLYEKYLAGQSSDKKGWSIIDMFLGTASAEELDESTAKEAKKKGNILTDIITTVKDVFSSISSDKGLRTIAIILGISYILKLIRDLVDNIQFIDDIGWTAKWIGFSVLITGLIGILGYITILAGAAGDDANSAEYKKFERVKKVLTDFLNDIKGILGIITAIMALLTIKEIFSWRKELAKTNEAAKKTKKEADKVGDTIMDMAKNDPTIGMPWLFGENGLISNAWSAFGSGFGKAGGSITGTWAFGSLIGDLVENLSENANEALGELGSGIESLSTYLDTTVNKLAGIKGNIGDAIEVIPEVRKLITEMIGLLNIETVTEVAEGTQGAIFDEETGKYIVKAITPIIPNLTLITKTFNDISGSLSLFKNSVSGYGDDATKVTEALKTLLGLKSNMNEFAIFVKQEDDNGNNNYEIFKHALSSLGSILKLYSESLSEDFSVVPKKVNINNLVDFLKQLFEDDNFKSLINKFSEEGLVDIGDRTFENAEKIIVFTSALSSLADACNSLTGTEGESINKLIEEIGKLKFGDNQKDIDAVVQNFGTLGNALGSFALNTSNLSDENIKNADYALSMLSRIAIGLGGIHYESGLISILFGKSENLGSFGQNVKELGENLAHFFTSVDAVGSNGTSVTHNKENLEMMLTALDEITRIAIQFSYLGSDEGSIKKFKEFADSNLKENFKALGSNVGEFIKSVLETGKIINDETKETVRFEESDFDYINKVLDVIDDLSLILSRVTVLQFTNLTDKDTDKWTSPLKTYLETFISAISLFGGTLYANRGNLDKLKTYKEELQTYMNIVDQVFTMLRFTKTVGWDADVNENAKLLGTVAESLFGWTSHIINMTSEEDIYHEGMFGSILNFFKEAKVFDEFTEINPTAITVFNSICDVLTTFLNTIGEMYKTEGISDMFVHGFTSNYSTYVIQLGEVVQSILDQRATFEEFFNWGKDFNNESVTNVALMMDALNSIVQFVSTMRTTQSFTDTTLTNLETSHWSRLFRIIQDTIIGGNKDFFSPKITPVLDLDNFKKQAAEMWKELGFTEDSEGVFMSPNLSVTISGIDLPQLTEIDKKLDKLEEVKASINSLGDSISKMQFVFAVNDHDLTAALGESMDAWLNSNTLYLVRANMT